MFLRSRIALVGAGLVGAAFLRPAAPFRRCHLRCEPILRVVALAGVRNGDPDGTQAGRISFACGVAPHCQLIYNSDPPDAVSPNSC